MFFGIGIVIVGILLLLRTMGLLSYFTIEEFWPVILIVIGVLLGLKNNFRRNAWWILILIGAANLTPQFMIMGNHRPTLYGQRSLSELASQSHFVRAKTDVYLRK
jgi:hypothetical protein